MNAKDNGRGNVLYSNVNTDRITRRKFIKLGGTLAVTSITTTLLPAYGKGWGDFSMPTQGGHRSVHAQPTGSGWQLKQPPLTTPWTNEVSPENALPEYPRPQMTRDRWLNLNGLWEFAAAKDSEAPPLNRNLSERILVPFPVESALSGIMRHEDRMWYRRKFSVPRDWHIAGGGENSQRLLLHFDAVDYEAKVWINGKFVGPHKGGYDRFSFDLTDALHTDHDNKPKGEQEIIVGVYDPTENAHQPVGKQRVSAINNPNSVVNYTPSSGIWQTVWMEPVPAAHVERLIMTPDLENEALRLTVLAANAQGKSIEVVAYDGEQAVGHATGSANQQIRVPIPNSKLWSPDDPFLYSLTVRLAESDETSSGSSGEITREGKRPRDVAEVADDEVESYFGMRSIGLKTVNGSPHIVLNGEFIFQLSTLQQGYWPDGIYTAATDEALRFDLEQNKHLGFNTARKHQKVEPDRWYYHADRLGQLVWQDMPALACGRRPPDRAKQPAPPTTSAGQREFEAELCRMIDQHRNHPAIVMWIPFNEGWGDFDTTRIAKLVESWDPSRLVDEMSGSDTCGCGGDDGDVLDYHNIGFSPPAPVPRPKDRRAAIIGEFGAYGLGVKGHEWNPGDVTSPAPVPNTQSLTKHYVEIMRQIRHFAMESGLSAANYNLFADVEHQDNGLFTYDRKVLKPDAQQVRKANKDVIAAARRLRKKTD